MIRTLVGADLEACVELYVDTFNAPPWSESWTAEDARRRLEDVMATPRSHGVGAWDECGSLIGFAVGCRERSEREDHFLLREMCVRSDRRQEGWGTRLLGVLALEVAEVRHWYLLTAGESGAAAFYESLGFRPARRMGVYVRP